MFSNKDAKLKKREIRGDRVLLTYDDGTVKSVDKDKYRKSLSEEELKEFVVDEL